MWGEFRGFIPAHRSKVLKSSGLAAANALALSLLLQGQAQAERFEGDLSTVLMPDFYRLNVDGSVTFVLLNGQALNLRADQFVILDGGLLLIVDDVAKQAMNTLPVHGSLRTDLLNDLSPVRNKDLELVQLRNEQPLWAGDTLPLVELSQLSGDRRELAQNIDDQDPENNNGQSTNSIGEVPTGMAVNLGALGLLGLLTQSTDSQIAPTATVLGPIIVTGDTGVGASGAVSAGLSNFVQFNDEDGSVVTVEALDRPGTITLSPQTPNGTLSGSYDGYTTAGSTSFTANTAQMRFRATDDSGLTVTTAVTVSGQLILPDASVADNRAITIKGAAADDYIGYTAANTAARDPLTRFGWEEATTSTVDLGNGDNFMLVGDQSLYEATLRLSGGTGNDTIEVGEYFANNNANVTIDMSAGGTNRFTAPDRLAVSATLAYTGGAGDDSISALSWLANAGGTATFDMSRGGSNSLTATGLAGASGTLAYTGGPNTDSLSFGSWLGSNGGDVTIDMSAGGTNSLAATDYAGVSGNLSYIGGAQQDTLTFSSWFANNSRSGTYSTTIDMTLGGTNSLTATWQPAKSGDFTYLGGRNSDSLQFGNDFGSNGGQVVVDMNLGGSNSLTAGHDSGRSGTISYTGGAGADDINFGARIATNGGSANFDMSRGGNNTFVADEGVADNGTLTITGGNGRDDVTFGFLPATNGADVTIDNRAGGTNTFDSDYRTAESGNLTYYGGVGADAVSLGNMSAINGGVLTVDMSAGGTNTFTAGYQLAHSGTFTYTGGTGVDNLTLGNRAAEFGGNVTIDMRAGGANTLQVGSTAAASGNITYQGGLGTDLLTFGGDAARSGFVSLDLGDDVVLDQVTFQGSVALGSGVDSRNMTIQNFDPTRDVLDLAHTSVDLTSIGATTTEVASTAGTSIRITLFGVTTAEMAGTGVIV